MKVALVGSAPSSDTLAPFHDPSWQIWVCSPDSRGKTPRVDLWFELHGDLGWHEYIAWAPDYCQWLQDQAFPVFAQDQTFIPRAMTFPRDELIAKYTCYHFTSSFAWMFAYALEQGATEIGLFGIDMCTNEEYKKQRAGFQHFITLAMAKGVKVLAPDESDILQPPPLYGYDRSTAFVRKMQVRRDEIQGKIDKFQAEVKTLNHHIVHLQGCIDDIDYVQSVWHGMFVTEHSHVGAVERHRVEDAQVSVPPPATDSCVAQVSNPAQLNGRHPKRRQRSTSQSETLPNG